jgi:hypothetical protein
MGCGKEIVIAEKSFTGTVTYAVPEDLSKSEPTWR